MPDHFCIASDHTKLKFSSHVSPAADSYNWSCVCVWLFFFFSSKRLYQREKTVEVRIHGTCLCVVTLIINAEND